jgi:hypothetical protein
LREICENPHRSFHAEARDQRVVNCLRMRKGFQIHLSTAIVLMFVAGGLIKMNIGEREVNLVNGVFFFIDRIIGEFTGTGWPLLFSCEGPGTSWFSIEALLIDLFIAVLIMVTCTLLIENQIRREAPKP